MPSQVLLILMPWKPPSAWLETQSLSQPDFEIIPYPCGMYDSELPNEIPKDIWERVTILLTFQLFPSPSQAPNLRYVQLISAGANLAVGASLFDNTDVKLCTARGVHPPQIAEWVFATFLGFQHHLFQHYENHKVRKWVTPESDEDTEDCVGLRVGILGYGCIGRQCARVAKALGMSIHAYTLHEKSTTESRQDDSYTEPGLGDPDGSLPSQWFHGGENLNDFLASNLDMLVITLPLTPLTAGMIAKEQFQILRKRRAFVTNVGRGPIVNTPDLIQALDQGLIRGAALDVTDPEPLPAEHPLWAAKNIIITPHCSGNSNHYNERVLKILSKNIDRLARGEELLNLVDLSRGY